MSGQKKAKSPLLDEIEIDFARPDDAAEISRLLAVSFAPVKDVYTDEAFAHTTPPAEVISGRFGEGPIWVARLNGQIVGTVSGVPETQRYYVRSMAVDPKYQGFGIGKKLLEALEADAESRGYKVIYLYTTYSLQSAVKLYKSCGYQWVRDTAEEEFYGTAGVEMEKKIGK